ncbi:MAG TPA: STAS/SEC14 domain-containing protein [Polyangiaceae bacterium]|jgi:hypothetical protein|nr:STAS/SEC14 domain-containing protein [Polyangiaceae bacterium]
MHFNSPVGSVSWDDTAGAVCVTWKQFAEGEEFRAVVNAAIDLLVQRKATRWLADLRHLGAVTQEDQRWSAESWFPRATAEGMKYLALVSPRKIVAQMAVKTFMNKVNGRDLLIGNFEDIEVARSWLRAQK